MTSRFTTQRMYLATVILLVLLPLVSSGPSRTADGFCPTDAEQTLVYSPFRPYFKFPYWSNGNRQNCWGAADCLFEASGESRKQQFGATALVMGLIPITLKDVAWPARRVIYVTKPLWFGLEVLVLGLGLVPDETGDARLTRDSSRENNMIARKAWKMKRPAIAVMVALCSVSMVASYGGLAVIEIYSKRSALGCPWPIWVVSWYLVGLAPAIVHALFARIRRKRAEREEKERKLDLTRRMQGLTQSQQHEMEVDAQRVLEEFKKAEGERKEKAVSAVPGADEEWPVQLAWGLYYIAGTLIYTSIMAVTVVELLCWIALGFAVDGCSKLLAFFLCLAFEETGMEQLKPEEGLLEEHKSGLVTENQYDGTA